ncbi:S-layer homology domain-containing protein [Gorillibacterium sp. CAU 1737]|uniref:S-layer homology domain-containing protein n=1 Tax=Gorillibacterium sp. CAU 1737 TaxID=3140362 RepID=UPI00326036FA
MAQHAKKWLSIALIFSLLVALVPAPAQAAGASIMITGLYTTTDSQVNPATGKPIDDSSIPRYTSNPITLRANVTGISEEQVQSIFYEVYNPDTKQTVIEKLNKATLSGNQIVFNNVTLTEGLNRITIKMGTDSSGVSSPPGWAYLTTVTNITNLKIGEEVFLDGGIYPKKPLENTTNSLTITGTAQNSTQVEASAMGVEGTQTTSFPDGFFSFTIKNDDSSDASSLSGFNLKPGDNLLTFKASNSSTLSYYLLQRSFVYDNGKAFAFHTNVKAAGALDATYQLLASSPFVNNSNVTLKTDFKVPVSNGALKYDQVIFKAGGTSTPVTFASMTEDASQSTSAYKVFTYTGNLALTSTHRKAQTIVLEFSNTTNAAVNPFEQTFTITYVNASSPTVTSVGIGSSTAAANVDAEFTELAPVSTVTELPRKLRINTLNADKVQVKIDGKIVADKTIVTNYGEYILDEMLNGQHTITFTPYTGTTVDPANSVSYTLNINVAPYVILTNLTKGQVFQDVITPFANNKLNGRLVNVSQTEMPNVRISINDGQEDTLNAALSGFKYADGRFTGQFAYDVTSTAFLNGLNTIKFSIYNNKVLVSKVTYEFFYYKDSAPNFVSVYPENTNTNDFIPGSITDTYSTQLDSAVIKGQLTGATSMKLTVRATNAQGEPVSRSQTITSLSGRTIGSPESVGDFDWNNAIFFTAGKISSTTFSTETIVLSKYSDTTFEFEITNASNIKVTRTITIRREPLPYKITFPTLITNAKGELQANITSNYQTIELTSEGADQLLFGKVEANEVAPNTFSYEARNLKSGKNSIKFTVVKGKSKINGTLVLNYADTPVEGARYKTQLGSSLKVFNNQIQLSFPKNTFLTRNDKSTKPDLYSERYLLFGIANGTSGQLVDRDEDYYATSPDLPNQLVDRTGRFLPASPLYYMDAGYAMVKAIEPSPDNVNKGGVLPFAVSMIGKKTPGDGPTYLPFNNRSATDNLITNQMGKLTLQYDPKVTPSAWRYVTVMHFGFHVNEAGVTSSIPTWKNVGGVVDTSKNTITVPFQEFGYYRVFYLSNSWPDVINHPWARNELDALYAKGYMFNLQNNAFVPSENISRGEFAQLLVKIFDLPLNYSGKLSFIDVSPSQSTVTRDYRYIETAARAGIIRGVTEQSFAPTLSITRQDAAVMIARAGKLKLGTDPDKSLAALQKAFTDAKIIDYYARTSVEAVNKAKFITGKENLYDKGTMSFDPLSPFTRAEAAVVAMRVLKNQGKVP